MSSYVNSIFPKDVGMGTGRCFFVLHHVKFYMYGSSDCELLSTSEIQKFHAFIGIKSVLDIFY